MKYSTQNTRKTQTLRRRNNLSMLFGMLLVLSLSLSACRQSQSPTPEVTPETGVTKTIDAQGGTIALDSGAVASFEAGFFKSAATVRFYAVDDVPTEYPDGLKGHYPNGSTRPVAKQFLLEVPYDAINDELSFEQRRYVQIRIPAAPERVNPENSFSTEVHIKYANKESLFYFDQYRPDFLPPSDSPEDEDADDTLTLYTSQLLSVAANGTITISMQPVGFDPEASLTSQAIPSGFVLEDVVTDLFLGVTFDFAPNNRIYIAEKGGVVKVFANNTLQSKPFLDLSDEVNAYGDRGMLGLAVHPDFPNKPYIYLLYTWDPPQVFNYPGSSNKRADGKGARVSRLIRVTADKNKDYLQAVPGSEVILLGKNSTFNNIGNWARKSSETPSCENSSGYINDCIASDSQTHSIGTLRFAADGSLFVSSGDGSPNGEPFDYMMRPQDLDSLNGKLLRINPDTGAGYTNNPFYDGNINSNRSKVYNFGLRNPFRFAFHPDTGVPYIGDVGWATWEEINAGRGANFGWPCYEGGSSNNLKQGFFAGYPTCADLYENASDVTPPVHAYFRQGIGSSAQVGDFYTGSTYPQQYRGALFISDFDQAWIKYLTLDANGNVTSVNNFGTEAGLVQTLMGPDNNLYLMNIYEGKIKRLRYTSSGNTPPIASISANKTNGPAPLTVNFSSQGSRDPDGDAISYAWTFGDGSSSAQANPSHTFTNKGSYTVKLTVTDNKGASASKTILIGVGESKPSITITAPKDGARYNVGDRINFSATATDLEDGTLSGAQISWQLRMHHNDHTHFDGMSPTTGLNGDFKVQDHGDNTWLELCATAKDSDNQTSSTCVSLRPNTVMYTLDTVPSGLELVWEGATRVTPFTVETLVNANQQLVAPATQSGGYVFKSWSDGGARTHSIKVGGSNKTLVATYQKQAGTDACSKDILLVSSKATMNSRDRKVAAHLEALGYRVTGADDNAVTAASANGYGLVLISDTVAAAKLGATFRDVRVPVVVFEGNVFDDMKMTGTASNDYGFSKYQTQLDMNPVSHPLAAGLSGRVTVTTKSVTYYWGLPSNDAIKIAKIKGAPSKLAIFAYDTNAQMVGMRAPARRVGLAQAYGSRLTADGWKLLDASVAWAMSCSAPTEDNDDGTPTPPPNPNPTPTPTGNTPPVLQNPGNQVSKLGDKIALFMKASDADNDKLTYSATGLPKGLRISSIGKIRDYVEKKGTFNVTVTVSDGKDSTSTSFKWTVN